MRPSQCDKDGCVIQWRKAWTRSTSMAYAVVQDCANRRVLGEHLAIEVDAEIDG